VSTSKQLVDSKVAIENVSYAKEEMETQYQKYDKFVIFRHILNRLNHC